MATPSKLPVKKNCCSLQEKSKVNEAGNYSNPTLCKCLSNKIKAGGKGGKQGQ